MKGNALLTDLRGGRWIATAVAVCVLLASTNLCQGTANEADRPSGRIVGWGRTVVGADLSKSLVGVAAGGTHSLGLKEDGSIVTWGSNGWGQCNVPEPNGGFVDVAAGEFHSLGLREDGSIVAWGQNGQCKVPEPNKGFVAVGAGFQHTLGLKEDGSIVAWGLNRNGQCNVPAPNEGFVAIAAGVGRGTAYGISKRGVHSRRDN